MSLGKQLTVPTTESDHIKGRSDAPIELLQYGDYECPQSGKAFSIISNLLKSFGDSIRYVFRYFPNGDLHPHAWNAAKAAEAAALQKRFWQMHQTLFENQDELDEESLTSHAEEVGLNLAQFGRALHSPTVQRRIESDLESGIKSGVSETPTFFINGRKYEGDWSYESLRKIFEAMQAGKTVDETFRAA
jgi:protein-disulfide isomerase